MSLGPGTVVVISRAWPQESSKDRTWVPLLTDVVGTVERDPGRWVILSVPGAVDVAAGSLAWRVQAASGAAIAMTPASAHTVARSVGGRRQERGTICRAAPATATPANTRRLVR